MKTENRQNQILKFELEQHKASGNTWFAEHSSCRPAILAPLIMQAVEFSLELQTELTK